jgi:uncharacterized membrane protein
MIHDDAVILALLLATLALIMRSAASTAKGWQRFYTYVPALLLCYFIPSIYTTTGLVSIEDSSLYMVASRYLLPASLVLLTLSVDIRGIIHLGSKAGIMFLAGTLGIMIGGPVALFIALKVSPDMIAGFPSDSIWQGMATVAGSWIGGGANQTAMYEIFKPDSALFSAVVAVDIIVANLWMAVLLWGASRSEKIDRWLGADSSGIDELCSRVENYRKSITHVPSFSDVVLVAAVGFGVTGVGHLVAGILAPWFGQHVPVLSQFSFNSEFFWIIITSTSLGLALSFTPLRKLEGVGASNLGTLFLYVLIMVIGMKMDLLATVQAPGLLFVGFIWIIIHVTVLLLVAKLIRAPFFFVAVGSQANIGGAASAPVIASAFNPSLASVGVLLAVLGYVLGTYGALLCVYAMRFISTLA